MSKFHVWVDDDRVVSDCQSPDVFEDDTQRKNGFRSGTGASAIRVNTALRQANLIAVALVNALNIPDDYDLRSSLDDMKSWFESTNMFKLSRVFTIGNVGTENIINESIQPKTTNTYDLGTSSKKFKNIYATAFKGTADAATNATNAEIADKVKKPLVYIDMSGTHYKAENAIYSGSLEKGIYLISYDGQLGDGTWTRHSGICNFIDGVASDANYCEFILSNSSKNRIGMKSSGIFLESGSDIWNVIVHKL